MRIGLTSDIHTDISPANKRIVQHLASEVKHAELDILVICGDISPDVMTLSATLSAFHDNDGCKKLFVAGNHDIWLVSFRDHNITSHQKYSLITAICNEHGFHHLGDSPLIIDGVGFCGNIGWYDYSYKSEKYNIPERNYIKKSFAGSIWNDVNFARWDDTDPNIARHFEQKLQSQIDSIKDEASQIIVATHHVPFRECVLYRDTVSWDFFSAFMGSAEFGEICHKESLVTHVLFGHTHTEWNLKVKDVWAICSPIGYLTDPPEDLREYAKSRLKIIEIP